MRPIWVRPRGRWCAMARPRRRRRSACRGAMRARWKPSPMAEFDYIAIDPAGRERKGAIKAETVEDARAKLDSRKLFIVRIEAGAVEKARRRAGLSFRAPRLSPKELTLFTRQLSTLIQ